METGNCSEFVIPRGKHRGKKLRELSWQSLASLYGVYAELNRRASGKHQEIVRVTLAELNKRRADPEHKKNQRALRLEKKRQKKRKQSEKWDGVLEAKRQTDAELAQINAKRGQVLWVSPWVGGSEDWSERIPGRAEQG